MSGGRVLSALTFAVLLSAVATPTWAQVQLLGSESGVLKASELTQTQKQQLSQRIAALLENPDPIQQYHAQKAQSWLDYANHQNSEGGLTQAYDSALEQAVQITTQLEQRQQPSMTTVVPPSSGVMRRDLWAIAELLKTHPAFATVQAKVAEAEVKLVWAAAEHCELGWRHSREHFAAAERDLYVARQQANQQADAPQWRISMHRRATLYPTPANL
ncbi:MAG: hypothetical protein ACEQSD_11600 [Flavobacteriales bacterium]